MKKTKSKTAAKKGKKSNVKKVKSVVAESTTEVSSDNSSNTDAHEPALSGDSTQGVKAPSVPRNPDEVIADLKSYFRDHPHVAKGIYDSIVNNKKLLPLLAELPRLGGMDQPESVQQTIDILGIRAEWR